MSPAHPCDRPRDTSAPSPRPSARGRARFFAQRRSPRRAADRGAGRRGADALRPRRGALRRGNHDGALIEFQRAWELSQRASVLFNIAAACQALHRYADAIEALERFLANSTDIRQRRHAQRTLTELRSLIAFVRINTTPADATLNLDGHTQSANGELTVGPGTHRVEAARSGRNGGLGGVHHRLGRAPRHRAHAHRSGRRHAAADRGDRRPRTARPRPRLRPRRPPLRRSSRARRAPGDDALDR